jgi:hypothetical protein
MTASGLRREVDKGNLIIERIAGKDFTTLESIDQMREKCRRDPKVHRCGSNPPKQEKRSSLSPERDEGQVALNAAMAAARKLKGGSNRVFPRVARHRDPEEPVSLDTRWGRSTIPDQRLSD